MGLIFGNDRNIRGCFHAYHISAAQSRGAVLKLPGGEELPKNAQEGSETRVGSAFSEPLLVTGFAHTQREAVSFVKVFGNRVYTYAFGHDPNASILTVDFMAFLIDGAEYSGIIHELNDKYRKGRVSASPDNYAKLGFPSGQGDVIKGFIVGMSTATADAEHSIQKVTMQLALPQVQGGS